MSVDCELITMEDNEPVLNPLYTEVFNITVKCLVTFGCPVIYQIRKLVKPKITYIVSSLANYEMTVRYLTIETRALFKALNIDGELEINASPITMNRITVEELNVFNEVKNMISSGNTTINKPTLH